MKKHFWKERKNALMAAAITVVLSLVIFIIADMWFGGNYTLLESDLSEQHIPFIKSFWRAVFGKENVLYSFSLGLGTPTTVPYIWSAVLSPFHIFFYLFSDEMLAITIVLVGKYALAAYFFSRMLQLVWNRKGIENTLFSCFYALCGYSIVFYMNIQFADGVFMLPLVFLLSEEFRKTGKWKALTIAYVYLFVVQFYEGYLVGITCFLFLLLSVLLKEKKAGIKCLLKYLGCVLVAALLSACVLVPAAYYLLVGRAEDISELNNYHLSLFSFCNLLNNFTLGCGYEIQIGSPVVYCGLLSILLCPFYFINKTIQKNEKIIFGILLVFFFACSLIKPFYMLIHMMDVPDGWQFRFSYIISFLVCIMSAEAFAAIGKMKKKFLWIVPIVLLGIYYFVMVEQNKMQQSYFVNTSTTLLLVNVLFILLYVAALYLRKKTLQKVVVLILCFSEIVLNGVICLNKFKHNTAQLKSQYEENIEQVMDELTMGDGRITSNGFMNDASEYGYMGTAAFCSFENVPVRNFMKHTGYFTSERVLIDSGNTRTMRTILGSEYLVVTSIKEDNVSLQVQYTKEQALPLAYMVSKELKEFTFSDYNAPQNINDLVSAMCGKTLQPFLIYQGEVQEEGVNAEHRMFETDGEINLTSTLCLNKGIYHLIMRNEPAYQALYHFIIPAEEGKDAYAFFVLGQSILDARDPDVVSKPEENLIQQACAHVSRMVPLFENMGKASVTVKYELSDGDMMAFEDIIFSYEDRDIVNAVYEELLPGAATNFERSGTNIAFDVNVTTEKPLLFTTIPYGKGWHLYVDGSEVDIEKLAEGTFIGAELMPGIHHITMAYKPIINRIGLVVSGCGIVIFGMLVFIELQMRKKRKLQNGV